MSRKNKTIIIALSVILLAGLSLLIALRLQKIGEKPVAPKPKAEGLPPIPNNAVPADGCHFEMNATQPLVCTEPPVPTLSIKKEAQQETMPVISWNCNPLANSQSCFVIKKYVYDGTPHTSGSCTTYSCGSVPSSAVPTTINIPEDMPIQNNSGTCYYNDKPTTDLSKCIVYRIEAKNILSNGTCDSCITDNSTSCCLVTSNDVLVCGIAKSPVTISISGTNLTWTDSSGIEDGYKIYVRDSGPGLQNGFQISSLDIPVGAVGENQTQWPIPTEYQTGHIFSVLPYTNLCGGCPGIPTGTPTTTPIVTATATPPPGATATATPQATSTPLPTSTPAPLGESYCDYITANPTNGQKTLTVNFTGKGFDTIRIKGYRFTFGDGQKKEFIGTYTSEHIQSTQHDYATTGKFLAQLEILDDGDHWRTRNECKVEIIVTSPAAGPTSPPGVPATSTPRPTSVIIVQVTSTPRPTSTTALVAQGPTSEQVPTEVKLPEAGIKIPALGGLFGGFILLAIGLAILF